MDFKKLKDFIKGVKGGEMQDGSSSVGTFTSKEAFRAMGVGRHMINTILGEAVEAGLIEYAGKRKTIRIDQSAYWTPVYRFTKKGKK